MERRTFIRTVGTGAAALVAGCSGQGSQQTTTETEGETTTASETTTRTETGTTVGTASGDRTLVVATYSPFVDAPSSSPGAWLKEQFESEYDATLVWQTPDSEINYYIERALQNVDIEADVYVGLNTDTLIRIDEKLDQPLFAEVGSGDIAGRDDVKQSLEFDPKGRAIPYDTGYISLVWNENEIQAPATFDGLLDSEFSGDLITQNPTSSETGRAFLLHTIKARGADGYLDYWKQLKDNDVRVLGTWSDAYTAYSSGEAPMVVSYSTDQVYAHRADEDLSEHQIRFLNDQGYANPEGMAQFADTDNPDLARQFMEFVLTPEVQAEIAVRNVQFPATTTAELPDEYAKYALEPPEPVTFTYQELKGNVGDWVDAWAQQFASK
ncbi:MAG: thiamine ABC transporter substrate binding subunit [Haloferacaceae archaeon]